MSPVPGFFETRSEAKRGRRDARVISSWETINKAARSPDMEPTGSTRPDVYVLGEAPGEEEDTRGVQFVGSAGRLLRSTMGEDLVARSRFDNACRTRPPKNRTPLPEEVEHYRRRVVRDIESARPKIILGTGAVPLKWMFPDASYAITACRGRRFPVRVGSHLAWFMPILHPSFINRVKDQKKQGKQAPGREYLRLFQRDVGAVEELLDNYEEPVVLGSTEAELFDGVELLTDPLAIRRALREMCDQRGAFDIETTRLRPYAKGARIISAAVSVEGRTIAFPFLDSIVDRFGEWLCSDGPKIAHTSDFELEWMVSIYGPEIAWRVNLEDTNVKAYCVDERPGAFSLDFLCRQYLGLPLKGKSSVNRKRMEDESEDVVLRYNALDAKYTLLLDDRLSKVATPVAGIVSEYMKRIPAAVLTQWRGIEVDVSRVETLRDDLSEKMGAVTARIVETPEAADYRSRYGKFNPTSTTDVTRIFEELGYSEALVGYEGKKTSDEGALKKIDHPLARLVLELRELGKLKGTYVDRLHPSHARTYTYPDGKMHPEIHVLGTGTGRSSSSDPNEQNFPKRKHREIRKQIVAGRGRLLVASDQGQIEARVIAALSGDPFFCQAIRDDYDIHMEWAERVAKLWPPTFRKYGKDMKKFRSEIKNTLVFPLFYGTSAGHVGMMLDLPRRVSEQVYDEFWNRFPDVRRWQQKLLDDYEELGYVEGPTGRRSHAPKSVNQVINTPVQGAAFDIVADCWARLSRLAWERNDWDLQPIIQVHDDLTCSVRKKRVEEAIETIVNEMLACPFDWMTVPLSVEVEVGPDWYNLSEVGQFKSA